jgi:hypothetical protein
VSVRLAGAPPTSPVSGRTTRTPDGPPTEQLKASLRRLLAVLLERGFGVVLDSVERLAGTFDEIAARGGVKMGALWGGATAGLSGRNPVWGAVKGAFSALSTPARGALIIALVLALLLLPVTVVLLLLALIALAIIAVVKTRSASA